MRYGTKLGGFERNLARAKARAEFEAPVVAAWLQDLHRQGLGLALPALIVKLDALSRADLPCPQRVELLRLLKRTVLRAPASHRSGAVGVTLEQRLLSAMEANYRRTVHDLSRVEHGTHALCDDARSWAARNLFNFTERQIRYGVDWRLPWPAGTWQELHDLFVLLSVRGPMGLLVPTPFDAGDSDLLQSGPLDPKVAYKRLLLLGLASQVKPGCGQDPVLVENLDAWAAETRLDEPESRLWDLNVYVVEVAQDSPPRQRPGVLEASFHGWVLALPNDFLSYIGRAQGAGVPDFHPFDLPRAVGQN